MVKDEFGSPMGTSQQQNSGIPFRSPPLPIMVTQYKDDYFLFFVDSWQFGNVLSTFKNFDPGSGWILPTRVGLVLPTPGQENSPQKS